MRTRGKRRDQRKLGLYCLVLAITIIVCGAFIYMLFSTMATIISRPLEYRSQAENFVSSSNTQVQSITTNPSGENMIVAYSTRLDVSLNSSNVFLMDFDTREVLMYQSGTARIYPASLVKMMTALVAIENISNLNEMVMLNEAIFQPIYDANATTAGFLPGDSVRAIDLLFGLLLPSGAECATGLAKHVAGTEYAFVVMMNERAKEIGMNNTHFTNTTGLHNENQYSTVVDMAILLRYALENEIFYQIITSSRHSTAGTSLRPGGITFHSTLFSRMYNQEFYGGVILGGRTGFINQSGQNLASFALVDGTKYILVTSGARNNGNHLTQALHIEDAFTVYGAINNR